MKKKSLAFNSVLSGFQKLFSIVFPLITFPYISRILYVEDIGKINFVSSFLSYFVLVAGLGINNYATREAAKIRDDKKKLNQFASEIFSINIITTIISYLLLCANLLIFRNLDKYNFLILVHSFLIIGSTLSVSWVYSMEEDYLYITIRSIVVQIISLILLFIFVHKPSDYFIYAIINVFSQVGASVFNFFNSKKYVSFKFTFNLNFKKHLSPILVIFASAVAVTIYVNSDMTLLGIICDDEAVGLYSRSVRIYSIIKQMVASMVIVGLPHLSNILKQDNFDEYINVANDVFKNILMISLPVGIGISCTAGYIINIIAGSKYSGAIISLMILGVSSIFAILSSFNTYCVLLPLKKEKIHMVATYLSAILNVVLNIFILKTYGINGAAFTTLLSELLVFVIGLLYIKKKTIFYRIYSFTNKELVTLLIGVFSIIFISTVVPFFITNYVICFVIIVIISVISYFSILYLLKYSSLLKFLKKKKLSKF